MSITSITEMIDQYVRESTVNPDKESHIINLREITYIFTIGTDEALYLTKENESKASSRFSRYKLADKVISLAAVKLNDSTIAVSIISGGEVYVAYTSDPEKLTLNKFTKMDFSGALGGIALKPYKVLIAALSGSVSLFIEFHDKSGFTQQFVASLGNESPTNASYFRLPAEFTQVVANAAGRSARQFVDGVYTYGVFHAGNDSPYASYSSETPQLIYTPSRNPFGTTLPAPIRLKTESGLDAICTLTCGDKSKPGTHLFAVGGGKLYFYKNDNQLDWLQTPGKGTPKIVAESDKLLNATKISAYRLGNRVYIFIRTTGGDLNYTVSDYSNDMPEEFLEPVSLESNVLYFDTHDGKLSIFTSKSFIECTQDAVTGAFNMNPVTVESSLDKHRKFSAYSTKIDIGNPNADVILEAGTTEKIGFYSGGYYYKTNKAVLKSDSLGYLTVVQPAEGLTPDCFKITHDGSSLAINPADFAQKQLLSMTNETDFKDAVVTDVFGDTSPLVSDEKQSSLSAAAAGMSSLRNAAIGIIPGIDNPVTNFANGVIMTITDKVISILPAWVTDNPFSQFVSRVVSDITAAFRWVFGKIKDLFDKTIGKAINLIIQKTQKVWKFFAEIGGKVISVVLDCAAKVVETIKNVLEMIGVPVGKIIDFFKKALGLDRADKINAAMKNVASLSIDLLIEKASALKQTSVNFLIEAVDKVEKWAGIDKTDQSEVFRQNPLTANYNSQLKNMGISLSSHNMYAFDLIGGNLTGGISSPAVTMTSGLEKASEKLYNDIAELKSEISKLPASLSYIADQMTALLKDFNFTNLINTMKKILGTVAVGFLNISRVIIKTIFDVVIEGIRAVWKAVSTPINIPFVSDVLKLLGVKSFSMIDVVTYPAAFLASAVSGIAHLFSGKEIIDLKVIDKLANMKSLNELKKLRYSNIYTAADAESSNSIADPMMIDRDATVAIKVLIGFFAIAEMIIFAIMSAFGKKSDAWQKANKGKMLITEGLSIGLTIIDFTLSACVGYLVYAPMDASADNVKDTEYAKLIEKTSEASGRYTNIWIAKTCWSVIFSALPFLYSSAAYKKGTEVDEDAIEYLGVLTSGVSIILALISILYEGMALAESCKVDGSRLTANQKKDKQAFQCETSGFIIDDVRAIFDGVISIGQIKNPYVITAREVVALGYPVTMFAEAGIIN